MSRVVVSGQVKIGTNKPRSFLPLSRYMHSCGAVPACLQSALLGAGGLDPFSDALGFFLQHLLVLISSDW